MNSLIELSRTLTQLVYSQEGVREVYAASSLRGLMAGTVFDAETQGALVSVHQRGGSIDVYAIICVDADYSLPAVLRRVSDAVSQALLSSALLSTLSTALDAAPTHIAVTASRIQ